MSESLGMVMIFTLISSTIDWLGNKWEEIKALEDENVRRKREELDAEEKVNQKTLSIKDHLWIFLCILLAKIRRNKSHNRVFFGMESKI